MGIPPTRLPSLIPCRDLHRVLCPGLEVADNLFHRPRSDRVLDRFVLRASFLEQNGISASLAGVGLFPGYFGAGRGHVGDFDVDGGQGRQNLDAPDVVAAAGHFLRVESNVAAKDIENTSVL